MRVKSENTKTPVPAPALGTVPLQYHTLGANLSLDPDEVLEQDDPMKYFYSVRLIVEGAGENGHTGTGAGTGSGEEFEGSVMEVQADKIRYVHGSLFPTSSPSLTPYVVETGSTFPAQCLNGSCAIASPAKLPSTRPGP